MEGIKSNIKQPEPTITASTVTPMISVSDSKKRKYNTPYVGVVEAPKLSTTPILDAYCKTKEENPHIKYKVTSKKYKLITPQTLMSFGVLLCGAICLKAPLNKAAQMASNVLSKLPFLKNIKFCNINNKI